MRMTDCPSWSLEASAIAAVAVWKYCLISFCPAKRTAVHKRHPILRYKNSSGEQKVAAFRRDAHYRLLHLGYGLRRQIVVFYYDGFFLGHDSGRYSEIG